MRPRKSNLFGLLNVSPVLHAMQTPRGQHNLGKVAEIRAERLDHLISPSPPLLLSLFSSWQIRRWIFIEICSSCYRILTIDDPILYRYFLEANPSKFQGFKVRLNSLIFGSFFFSRIFLGWLNFNPDRFSFFQSFQVFSVRLENCIFRSLEFIFLKNIGEEGARKKEHDWIGNIKMLKIKIRGGGE